MYYQKHKKRTRRPHRRRVISRKYLLIAAAMLMVMALTVIAVRVRPLLEGVVRTQASNHFSGAVNDAVLQSMSQLGNGDAQLVSLSMNESGAIAGIETDAVAVNELKSLVGREVIAQLGEYEEHPIKIPIGTLTGIDLLTGTGPEVELRLRLAGGVQTELQSSFESAGVNQTLHTIECVVKAEVYAIMPGYRKAVTLETNVMVAQSVIVGETPDSFTYVYGDQNDTIGRIFDYGDPYGNG